MKVNSAVLSQFLGAVNLSGEIEIKECILRGTTDSLKVIAVTASKVVIVAGELAGDFSSIGDIGVDDLSLLKRMLTAFTGDIELTKTANKILLSNGKKTNVELVLRNPTYILNEIDQAKFDGVYNKAKGNEFSLTVENIRELQKYYGVFGKEVVIDGDGNDIVFNVANGDNSLDLGIEVPEKVAKFSVKIASLFMNILGNTSGTIKVSVNDTAKAILVSFSGEVGATAPNKFTISYIVAPLMK